MTKQEILAKVDHTLLKADAGWEDIRRICDEALENSTASICINPCWVERAVEYLGGRVPVHGHRVPAWSHDDGGKGG